MAWSAGLRPEERQELTRRAPSHDSLTAAPAKARTGTRTLAAAAGTSAPPVASPSAAAEDSPHGIIQFHLQVSGRAGWGFTRVAGVEHTRRGGGRVWTDFLVCDAAEASAHGLHINEIRAALAAAPELKQPLGGSPLPRVGIARVGSGSPAARGARAISAAAATASLLLADQACVIAAGTDAPELLEDALRMIPASLRAGIDVCAGFRFSPSRGVKVTITDRIDQDTMRATRGQGVVCVDLEKQMPQATGPMVPWLTLMSRWWSEERGADATELADRLGAGWTAEEIVRVASLCEAIDRGEERPERLGELLVRRNAA